MDSLLFIIRNIGNMNNHGDNISSILLILQFVITLSNGTIVIPGLRGKCHGKLGDLNLVLLQQISRPGTDHLCSETLASVWRPQYVEAFKYAIQEVNARPDILPNVTLGYLVMDTCMRDMVALARALHFMTEEDTYVWKGEPTK